MIARGYSWRWRGTRVVGALVLAFAASSGACGARTSLDQASIAEPDYPDAVAHASCDGIGRCCKLAGYHAAKNGCVAQTRSATASLAAEARQHGAHYDGVAAARCVAQVRRAIEQCLPFKEIDRSGCGGVYSGGDLPTGSPCTANGQCVPGDSCYGAGGSVGFTCLRHAIVGNGEACGWSANEIIECRAGLICRNGTCQPWLPLGTPCPDGAVGDMCAPGAVCDFDGSKTCVPARAVGSACTDATQCEGYACHFGHCQLVPQFVLDQYCSL